MSITSHHNDWLSVVPNSGPFLSLAVLAQAFPQGLDAHDADHTRRLRMAFDEWEDNQMGRCPDPAIHRAWIKLVLEETLGYKELLAEGQAIPQTLKSEVAEYGVTLRPDWIVNDPATKKARLLVQVYPRSQSLTKPVLTSWWKTSPDTRVMQLLHDTGIRLGIVTNGDHWMLVNAPKNQTTGYVSWYADLWLEEKDTLRAFRTLLCADRFFSVPENETLEALLDDSASDQQEVTDQLGYQVRKAVEVLIQEIAKLEYDSSSPAHMRNIIGTVDARVLYESALTVMMRLVFLFCAEERELLLLGDDLYDKNYSVSTLREQLQATADQFGEEILGLRYDAWARLLTTFRAVYAGVKHDRLKLLAYGGSLLNPDRFPFLEGRKFGTSWKDTEATPLPVSNRTVLHLLEALQVLQVRLPGGGAAEARKVSFRSLDIEKIGHVYEGLLDHTAARAAEPVLGLQGTRDSEPEIVLAELEKFAAKGEKELLMFLKGKTGRSESAIKKGLNAELDDQLISRFRTACQDSDLWGRVKPFAGLVRLDTVAYPVVITKGSVFVTTGTDRRSSGTHYTPKILTKPIVQYTLEPLVYIGPADALSKDQWKLRSAKQLLALKICDMACGSGAFLVEACRYMAERLFEAWDAVQRANPGAARITPDGESSIGHPGERLIPDDPDERQTYALRIVAQRCLYGVDKNPLAVEMAKLSLWLLTLAKDKPFEFLDHAIRCGDSLVGINSTEQLGMFNLDGEGGDNTLFLQFLNPKIKEAIILRSQIVEMQANTAADVEAQDLKLREANEQTDRLKCAADMLVGAEFLRWDQNELIHQELEDEEHEDVDRDRASWQPSWVRAKKENAKFRRAARIRAAIQVAAHFHASDIDAFRQECSVWLNDQIPFHWPLEFPEIMVKRGGFDAFVGNPPFMGGTRITDPFGVHYRDYLVTHVAKGMSGRADLCAYFLLRANTLLHQTGTTGFIATNSISQGDSREVGLNQLIDAGITVFRAVRSSSWPGRASLEIAQVWLTKSSWGARCTLDALSVRGISSYLETADEGIGEPYALFVNQEKSFLGSYIHGSGFLLTLHEAESLIAHDTSNRDVLFPYHGGEDVNKSPDQSAPRWAINFFNWPLSRETAPSGYSGSVASDYPDCLARVEQMVKTHRENSSKDVAKAPWWQYWRIRKELYDAISGCERVLVRARIANTHSVVWLRTRIVLNDKLVVFVNCSFAVLQSDIHEAWSRIYSSTLRTDMQYTPSDCFVTFPFPLDATSLDPVGEEYHEHRSRLMLGNCEGLTKTYNRFHNPKETTNDIQKLRQLHNEMNHAVASAYGWTDLDLGHGFHETKQGVRYTINEVARREVLSRLLKLNHERYAEEVKQGLHDKMKGKAKRTTPKKAADKEVNGEATLFAGEEGE